ncbi:MAG: hypothetical protein NT062_36450 [Proteobacteria bacterium]|nr:hypothetical protein [Pseudomonadota bacterium]
MAYAERFTAVKRRIMAAASRAHQRGPAIRTQKPLEVMRSSMSGQSRYLRWLSLGAGLQVIEILVLAWVHYVYFPPASIKLLRIVSSFGTAIVIVALASSRKLFSQAERPGNNDVARIRETTSVIFLLALVTSCAISVYLARAGLDHSTPPIFRAVLMSTLLTLPLVSSSTFLIYHLRSWDYPALSPWFRWLSVASGLCGIAMIVADLPLAYLAVRLVPVILFARACWSRATGLPLRALFQIRVRELRTWTADIVELFKASATALIGFLCVDVGFYLAIAPGRRALTWIPLFAYVAHKLLHTMVVGGVKETTRLLIHVRPYFAFQPRRWAIEIGRRLSFVSLGLLVSAGLIVPVLLIGRGVLFWRSLEGEPLRIAPTLIIGMCLWVALRAIWMIGLVGETLVEGGRASRWPMILAIAQVVTLAVTRLVLPHVWDSSPSDLMLVTVAVDLLLSLCGIVLLHQLRHGSYTRRRSAATDVGGLTLLPMHEVVRELMRNASGTTTLHWIEAASDVSASYFKDRELGVMVSEIGHPTLGVALNRRSVVLITKALSPSRVDELHRRWLTRSASVIRRLRATVITPATSPLEGLRNLFDETQPVEASLLSVLRVRRSINRPPPTLAITAHALLVNMRDRPDTAIRRQLADDLDVHCFHAEDSWEITSTWPEERQVAMQRFFAAYRHSGDLLLPERRRNTESDQIVHLVRADNIALVAHVGAAQRTTILYALHQLCLKTNLDEIARAAPTI